MSSSRFSLARHAFAQLTVGTRWALPVGWLLILLGYLGPWIAHATAALSLTGADMGEFVKFLPDVVAGTVSVSRQSFYLPPLLLVVSIALLANEPRLAFPLWIRVPTMVAGIFASLQLLPPAWFPTGLLTPEFQLQTLAIGISWVLLASFWWLRRLPSWLTAGTSALAAAAGFCLLLWQFLAIKASIDQVYSVQPRIGWGFGVSLAGLAVVAAASVLLIWLHQSRWRNLWPTP
jgi:hypothetical protein